MVVGRVHVIRGLSAELPALLSNIPLHGDHRLLDRMSPCEPLGDHVFASLRSIPRSGVVESDDLCTFNF